MADDRLVPTLNPQYPDPRPNGHKGNLQCGINKPTNVISVSYGSQEHDLPIYYQERQCNEFSPPSPILAPGSPTLAQQKYFQGIGNTATEPESAPVDYIPRRNSNYSSGGDSSNIYSQPLYQRVAVTSFFENHDPPYPFYIGNQSFGANGGLYNRIGRGYPDVAANGDHTAVYNEGILKLSGDTSASTPIFAVIINRINEERLAVSKRSVGFVNPVLYANPWAVNDITNGKNLGCGTNNFSAVPGWDPVTGLGIPNYSKICELFLSLPLGKGTLGDNIRVIFW